MDSLLKQVCSCLWYRTDPVRHGLYPKKKKKLFYVSRMPGFTPIYTQGETGDEAHSRWAWTKMFSVLRMRKRDKPTSDSLKRLRLYS